nr:helix-turn-helix domain-containing protein [Maritalea mediterranea]
MLFKALADYNRRMILQAVVDQPEINLTDLCSFFPMSRFAIMKHISVLVSAELLTVESDGKFKRYRAQLAPLESHLMPWLHQLNST